MAPRTKHLGSKLPKFRQMDERTGRNGISRTNYASPPGGGRPGGTHGQFKPRRTP